MKRVNWKDEESNKIRATFQCFSVEKSNFTKPLETLKIDRDEMKCQTNYVSSIGNSHIEPHNVIPINNNKLWKR